MGNYKVSATTTKSQWWISWVHADGKTWVGRRTSLKGMLAFCTRHNLTPPERTDRRTK